MALRDSGTVRSRADLRSRGSAGASLPEEGSSSRLAGYRFSVAAVPERLSDMLPTAWSGSKRERIPRRCLPLSGSRLDQPNMCASGVPSLIRKGRSTASLTWVAGSMPRACRMVAPRSSGLEGSLAG